MTRKEKYIAVTTIAKNSRFSMPYKVVEKVVEYASDDTVQEQYNIYMKDKRRVNTCWRNIFSSSLREAPNEII